MSYGMSRKSEWVSECILNYVKHGVTQSDAQNMAHADALKEEVAHGSVVDIWEPADALVSIKMQQWSYGV